MNITDLIIILLMALTVFLGYRKNLFRNFFDFFSLIAGFVVAFKFYGTFANVVEGLPGVKQALAKIRDLLVDKLQFDNDVTFKMADINKMNVTEEYKSFFSNGSFFKRSEEIVFSDFSISLVTNVLAIILLFLITLFLVRFIGSFIENSNKMAGLTFIDRGGGVIFSFLKSLIYAGVLAVVVHNISMYFNSGILYDLYNGSSIAKFLFESGLIGKIIG